MAHDLRAALDASVVEIYRRLREQRRLEQERRLQEEAEARKPLRNWLMYPYAFECITPYNVKKWTGLIWHRYEKASWPDAEEAVAQAIFELACTRELREAPRGDIGGYIYRYAGWNIRSILDRYSRVSSIEAIAEESGDRCFGSATLVAPLPSPQAKRRDQAKATDDGARRWTDASIQEAFRDYFRQHNKAPTALECNHNPELPSPATVTKFYDTLNDGLIAAGLTPNSLGQRTKAWSDREAALETRSFRSYEGRWPARGDFLHHPNLPSPPAIERMAGSTSERDVEAWIAYVLDDVGSPHLNPGETKLLRVAEAEGGVTLVGRGGSKAARRLEGLGLGSYAPGGQADGDNQPRKRASFTISAKGREALGPRPRLKLVPPPAPVPERDLPQHHHELRRRIGSRRPTSSVVPFNFRQWKGSKVLSRGVYLMRGAA